MSLLAAILLGAIQGFTEFLPVSSSAHLILARAFFGWEMPEGAGLAFDVAVHVGTLAAILVFFRREIAAMVVSLPTAVSTAPDPQARTPPNSAPKTKASHGYTPPPLGEKPR